MLGIKNFPTKDEASLDKMLTIASGPVIIEDGKVLLDMHGEDDFWKFPGGTLSQDDSLRENAKREVREELGIEVELADKEPFVMDISKEKEGKPMTIILFHYFATRLTKTITSGRDVREWAWHDIDHLPENCAMNIRAAVEYFRKAL